MVVSAVPAPAVDFTCNGNPVEQVATFQYMGLLKCMHNKLFCESGVAGRVDRPK